MDAPRPTDPAEHAPAAHAPAEHASAAPPASPLPSAPRDQSPRAPRDHALIDRQSLELARVLAAGLPTRPDWIALAQDNLRRWSQRNADAPRLLRAYAEWAAILDRPVDEVVRVLLDPSDEGQRLRQNNPFAGALSAREVWDIKARVRAEADAEWAARHAAAHHPPSA